MLVQPSDTHDSPGGMPLQVVADRDPSRGNRPSHDRPVTGHGKRTIDRHPKHAGIMSRFDRAAKRMQLAFEVIESLTIDDRGSHDRGTFEERPSDQGADILLDELDPGRVSQITLGQNDQAPGESQQAEDLDVFTGLGHDRIVGRDDQHRQIKARRAGQHVADKPFVTRHIDDRQSIFAQGQRRESQVNRDAALFLGRQAIGVHTGQGADQGRLAMIDVSRRTQDKVARAVVHHESWYCSPPNVVNRHGGSGGALELWPPLTHERSEYASDQSFLEGLGIGLFQAEDVSNQAIEIA